VGPPPPTQHPSLACSSTSALVSLQGSVGGCFFQRSAVPMSLSSAGEFQEALDTQEQLQLEGPAAEEAEGTPAEGQEGPTHWRARDSSRGVFAC